MEQDALRLPLVKRAHYSQNLYESRLLLIIGELGGGASNVSAAAQPVKDQAHHACGKAAKLAANFLQCQPRCFHGSRDDREVPIVSVESVHFLSHSPTRSAAYLHIFNHFYNLMSNG